MQLSEMHGTLRVNTISGAKRLNFIRSFEGKLDCVWLVAFIKLEAKINFDCDGHFFTACHISWEIYITYPLYIHRDNNIGICVCQLYLELYKYFNDFV